MQLLEKIRKLNKMLAKSSVGRVAFDELCESIGDLIGADVFVVSKRGKIMAGRYNTTRDSIAKEENGIKILPENVNEKLLKFEEIQENVIGDATKEIYGDDYPNSEKYHMIIPVIFGNTRVATVVMCRKNDAFTDEDIAIGEYGATVVGLEVSRSLALEEEIIERNRNTVMGAIDTLSYSEQDAVVKIFRELEGDEGILTASKIADKYNITRSVIVNALRKLESAGVIESRSLGMKGTRIKIVNAYLREGIAKIGI